MSLSPQPGRAARWLRRLRGGADGSSGEVSSEDLDRAARILLLRSAREATGLFAGNYASAFRGGGLEFEESRPYEPGDDVRSIDWNATARHGQTYVKRFREERNQTLLFALDVSGSMRFRTALRSKAATAAQAVALLATAAGRTGDRTGLVTFDERVRAVVPVARGVAHSARVVRTATFAARRSAGETRLDEALRAVATQTHRRGVLLVLSDFRDGSLLPAGTGAAPAREALAELAMRHDLVSVAILDPREIELPSAGPVRIADPERPGRTFVLNTSSRRARRRYLSACEARRRQLERALRRGGSDLLWLRTDRDPLYALGEFFRERAARRRRTVA